MKFARGKRKVSLIDVVFAVIMVIVVAVLLTDAGQKLSVLQMSGLEPRRGLTKPLRLEMIHSNAFEEFVIGLRTFHYRAQPRGVAVYSDVFF